MMRKNVLSEIHKSVLLAAKRPSGSVPQAQCRRIHALKVTTAIKRANVGLVIAGRSLRGVRKGKPGGYLITPSGNGLPLMMEFSIYAFNRRDKTRFFLCFKKNNEGVVGVF